MPRARVVMHVGDKQRVLMHGHQVWNVRHGLCHIYVRYDFGFYLIKSRLQKHACTSSWLLLAHTIYHHVTTMNKQQNKKAINNSYIYIFASSLVGLSFSQYKDNTDTVTGDHCTCRFTMNCMITTNFPHIRKGVCERVNALICELEGEWTGTWVTK